MDSNINELISHVRKMVEGMITSREIKDGAKQSSNRMKKSVMTELKSNSEYNYIQSYKLRRIMNMEKPEEEYKKTRVLMGFGEIDTLNWDTRRGPQRAELSGGVTVRLRPEQELPSWIIMEFGRKSGTGTKTSHVPKFIRDSISYTKREDKPYMIGPSTSMHRSKPIMFMTSKEMLQQRGETPKGLGRHPGITPGRFFMKGLENSKQDIYNILGNSIERYLDTYSSRGGL